MRLDKYLKVSRLIKRRELAKQIIDMGLVKINNKISKPSSEVNISDLIEISNPNGRKIIVKVLDIKPFTSVSEASKLYQIEGEGNEYTFEK